MSECSEGGGVVVVSALEAADHGHADDREDAGEGECGGHGHGDHDEELFMHAVVRAGDVHDAHVAESCAEPVAVIFIHVSVGERDECGFTNGNALEFPFDKPDGILHVVSRVFAGDEFGTGVIYVVDDVCACSVFLVSFGDEFVERFFKLVVGEDGVEECEACVDRGCVGGGVGIGMVCIEVELDRYVVVACDAQLRLAEEAEGQELVGTGAVLSEPDGSESKVVWTDGVGAGREWVVVGQIACVEVIRDVDLGFGGECRRDADDGKNERGERGDPDRG